MAQFLSSLTDEQKAKFTQALLGQEKVEKVPKKRGRPKKPKLIIPAGLEDDDEEVDETPQEIVHSQRNVKKIRIEHDEDEEDDYDEPQRSSRKGRKNRKGKIEGTFTRREAFVTGPRPNQFTQSSDFQAEKHLVKEDKEAWNKQKAKIPRNRTTLFEVECTRCHREFEVGGAIAHKRYVCDRCITEKR